MIVDLSREPKPPTFKNQIPSHDIHLALHLAIITSCPRQQYRAWPEEKKIKIKKP